MLWIPFLLVHAILGIETEQRLTLCHNQKRVLRRSEDICISRLFSTLLPLELCIVVSFY